MINHLKILHLEDVADDAELVARKLKKEGLPCEIRHVDSKHAFLDALDNFIPDIILSDHSLPSFDSHEALQLLKHTGKNIPFILVTATVSEEYAVSIIKEGADDYILKDRLQRLPSAIKAAMEKLKNATELANQRKIQEKLITETSIQVQERERDKIGKELHDNINQILATAKLYVLLARNEGANREDLLAKSSETITSAISEIRKLSHQLIIPSVGSTKLVNAVEDLVADIEAVTTLKFDLLVEGFDDERINKNINLMFYRIIQEQLNNIIKHASAEKVIIEMSSADNHLFLRITDDGEGFDLQKTAGGIGLRNIRNRVELHNGTTRILSAPGKGCKLEVMIPVREDVLIPT